MADDFFGGPPSIFDDESPKEQLAKLITPVDAETMHPAPPDSPPVAAPAQSTPLTGSLARPPQQAVAKNLDTVAGRGAYNVAPGQPNPTVQPARPASSDTFLNGRRTAIRDLSGNPAGSPLSLLQAMNPQGVQPASNRLARQASLAQPQTSLAPQPALQPARTGLAGTFQRQLAGYNNSPAPALYAASQTPASTDPLNPDPNASLRPGGSNPGAMQAMPATQSQQVLPPSQMDRDQARLNYLKQSGSGVDQIQNTGLRRTARVGDALLSTLLPGVAPFVGGSTARHQLLLGQQEQNVNNDQSQLQAAAQLRDTQSQTDQRQALADKAGRYDPNSTKTVETADGVMGFNPATGKYDQKIGDSPSKLNKYQVITAGDGTMFRIDPDDPTHAEPITGPDGKQLTGKQESKYIQLEKNGEEHTIEIGAGGKQTDLGPTGQKPMRVSVNGGGTWALDEDKTGKPILFNSKTGETKDAPDIQKAGTAAKAQAVLDKVNEPVDAAMNYANDYLTNSRFTGSGDEALQEKFFELAKPSVGFRMTQPQIDLLQNSRSWMNSAAAHLRHATKGTWFSDDQRKEIVQTMKDLAASKKKTGGGPPAASSNPAPGGFNWSSHPKVQP